MRHWVLRLPWYCKVSSYGLLVRVSCGERCHLVVVVLSYLSVVLPSSSHGKVVPSSIPIGVCCHRSTPSLSSLFTFIAIPTHMQHCFAFAAIPHPYSLFLYCCCCFVHFGSTAKPWLCGHPPIVCSPFWSPSSLYFELGS